MNLSEKNDSEILTLFKPLSSVLVAAPCSWVLHPNRDLKRIPGPIKYLFKEIITLLTFTEIVTEVICTNPGNACGGFSLFSCKQMKTLMKVSIKTMVINSETKKNDTRLVEENIAFRLGCSCTMEIPRMFKRIIPGIEEK